MLFPVNCFASDKTLTRTNENLLVPDSVTVTDNNREAILKTPAVSSEEKVYDFADLYNEDQEKNLFQAANNYTTNSSIDVVVVTTKDLKGFTLEQYAYNFYDYNMFKSEGIVFVIYIENEKAKLFMGDIGTKESKVFVMYNDKRTEEILSYIYPDIKEGNYYLDTDKYIKTNDGLYRINNNSYYLDEHGVIVKTIPWIELIILALCVTIVVVILCAYKLSNKSRKNKYNLDDNINETTMMVKLVKDELI